MIVCKASMHIGKKYSIKHNLRDYVGWNKDGHIDPLRTPLNVILINIDLRQFFEEIFLESITKYNLKNAVKHSDRITTVDQYFKEQKCKAQESILQLGDHQTYLDLVQQLGQEKADEFYLEALKKTFETWKNQNPSLQVFHASVHMDEVGNGTPHLHIDFLPVAESSRGLTTKVSLDGALKQLGFVRDKKDKYGNTPYKQWLRDRREKLEAFFQKAADSILGKGEIEVLPSEHSSKPHQETWEHREEQKGLAAVKSFLTGEGKAKVKAAEEIIANAEAVAKAIKAEAESKIQAATRATNEALRKEKAADKREKATKQEAADLDVKKAKAKEQYYKIMQHLKGAKAKQKIAVEQEVERRLSPVTYPTQQRDEDERYLQRRRTAFAAELEQAQEQGEADHQRTQELLEKAKHKATNNRKGDFER